MKVRTLLTVSAGLSLCLALAHPKRQNSTSNDSRPKLILDNDWGSTDFVTVYQALQSNYHLIGLTSVTGNTWSLQSALHALRALQLGNLTGCVPVYEGATYPLLNTPDLFQQWQLIHGAFPWQGAYAPYNATAESIGFNPTSGDPNRVNAPSFIGGTVPDQSLLAGRQAASFMVDAVRQYPGQVSIYAAGPLTNVALAVRLDPSFAQNAKELVVMGGYTDTNLFQVTGDFLQADINNDFNLKFDPESAKIALSANFTNITLVGNAANGVFLNATDLQEITAINNTLSAAYLQYAFPVLPVWDFTALEVLLDKQSTITNSTQFYVDVDTSYWSPYYGEIKPYQQILAPRAQILKQVTYPFDVNTDLVKQKIKQAIRQAGSCAEV